MSVAHGGRPARDQLSVPDVCDIPLGPQQACDQIGQFATDTVQSAYDEFTQMMTRGFATGLRMVIAWWTDLPSSELATATGEPGPVLSAIRDYSSGLQVVLLTAGIMFAAARLALAKRGGVAGEAQESFLMLARAVFGSMMVAALITTGTRAGDAFADWVIFDATRGDLTGAVDRVTDLNGSLMDLGTGMMLVIGLLGLISTLIQLVVLVVRQALLILVVAALPLAAAASGTGPGSQSYKKLLSWSLAFVLYKPVGALVYAIAFTVMGSEKQTDSQQVLLGLILLVMAVVLLPALVRMVAPAVATLGGGGGTTAVLAGGAAGVAMGSSGSSGSGRRVSEGENTPGDSGSGGDGPSGTGGDSSGGGGRGRPVGGGAADAGTRQGARPDSSATSTSTSGGSGARTTAAAGRGSSGGESASGTSGGGGGAAGAGDAGTAMAAQAAGAVMGQAASETGAQFRDAEEDSTPDALGPNEVRR